MEEPVIDGHVDGDRMNANTVVVGSGQDVRIIACEVWSKGG